MTAISFPNLIGNVDPLGHGNPLPIQGPRYTNAIHEIYEQYGHMARLKGKSLVKFGGQLAEFV